MNQIADMTPGTLGPSLATVPASPRSEPPTAPAPAHGILAGDPLRDALLESRQRWRDLVAVSADIAFETDAAGCFVFLSPDTIMGWPINALIGRASDLLLPDVGGVAVFNPFRADITLRNRRVWLKRPDGELCWMSVSVAPLLDRDGAHIGSRGVGRDVTEYNRADAAMARALRRSELIDHIVWHMHTEILAPRMMKRALQALIGTLGADGALIVESCETAQKPLLDPDGPPASNAGLNAPPPGLLHEVGGDVASVRELAIGALREGVSGPLAMCGPDGHVCLVCATPTRFDGCPGLVIWRNPTQRAFDADDLSLLGACIGAIRIVLEHGAIQQEMARQARTDALTGVYNRRAFAEDMVRRIERLERDKLPGTLMFIDLDNFKTLNDRCGHEAGDRALRATAALLRTASRPGDMVARLGGDEFAIWFDGMDDLAAAERADQLCRQAGHALQAGNDQAGAAGSVKLSISIGIATRWPGSNAEVDTLLRRADEAMYVVKRSGRGHWRVWHGKEADCGDCAEEPA